MVRIVGGILISIGFSLFIPSAATSLVTADASAGGEGNVAFVPLAMPLMFGPGAIATIIGMASLVREPSRDLPSLAAIVSAIPLTMVTTYLFLAYADRIGSLRAASMRRHASSGSLSRPWGMGLICHGVSEAIHDYMLTGNA